VASAGPAENGTAGSPVAFAGSVQGGSAPYAETWSFGDGTTASGTLTPAHTYASAGTYSVTLTVTDAAGVRSSSTTTASIAAGSLTATITGVPSYAAPVIVDNGTAGYSETGSWVDDAGTKLAYNGNARLAYTAAHGGSGNNSATWQLTGLAAGSYTVQASWDPYYSQAPNAPYAIYDGNTLLTTVLVDQTKAAVGGTYGGAPFQTLATVNVSSGTLKVVLSNANTTGTYIEADAIRVVPPRSSATPRWAYRSPWAAASLTPVRPAPVSATPGASPRTAALLPREPAPASPSPRTPSAPTSPPSP
jgi:PKD repeat protein